MTEDDRRDRDSHARIIARMVAEGKTLKNSVMLEIHVEKFVALDK